MRRAEHGAVIEVGGRQVEVRWPVGRPDEARVYGLDGVEVEGQEADAARAELARMMREVSG